MTSSGTSISTLARYDTALLTAISGNMGCQSRAYGAAATDVAHQNLCTYQSTKDFAYWEGLKKSKTPIPGRRSRRRTSFRRTTIYDPLLSVHGILSIMFPTYTIDHINMIPEIRAILLSFLIMPLKSYPTIAEFDYSNSILIVKPIGPDAKVSLYSKHNINYFKLIYFKDDINSVIEYDDIRSRKYILYVLRSSEL